VHDYESCNFNSSTGKPNCETKQYTTDKSITKEVYEEGGFEAGSLKLKTKGDAEFLGANINVKNSAEMDVGGKTTIGTVALKQSTYERNGNKDTTTNKTTHATSSFNVGGDFTSKNGDSFNLIGSQLNIGGNADIDAKSINILTALETFESQSVTKESKTDLLSSSTTTTTETTKSGTNIASGIKAGGELKMKAKEDIIIKGSDINSEYTSLIADGEIKVLAAIDYNEHTVSVEKTYAGISLGGLAAGVAGFATGNIAAGAAGLASSFKMGASGDMTRELTGTNKFSNIGGANGLSIVSGKNTTLAGANLNGGSGTANIIAGYFMDDEGNLIKNTAGVFDVNSFAVHDINEVESKSYKKELSSMDFSLFNKDSVASASVTFDYEEKNKLTRKETAKVNSILGGNINIMATNNLNSEGTKIKSTEGGVVLDADNGVFLKEAQDKIIEKESITKGELKFTAAVGHVAQDASNADKEYGEARRQTALAQQNVNKIAKLVEEGVLDDWYLTEARLAHAAAVYNEAQALSNAYKKTTNAANPANYTAAGGFGFNAKFSIEANLQTNNTNFIQTKAVLGEIDSAGGVLINSGNGGILQQGIKVNAQQGNIIYNTTGSIDIKAAEDKTTQSSSSKAVNSKIQVDLGATSTDLTFSAGASFDASGVIKTTHQNSTTTAQNGAIIFSSKKNLNIEGANVLGKDVVFDIKGNTTIQNAVDKTMGFSAGVSGGVSIGSSTTGSGGISGGFVNNKTVGQQTSIIVTNSITGSIDKNLEIDGAVLTTITSKTNENGDTKIVDGENINLKVGSLSVRDQYIEVIEHSASLKGTAGTSASGGKLITLDNLGHKSTQQKGVLYATIGGGAITNTNEDNLLETVSVNKDIDKASNIGQLVSTNNSVSNIYLDKNRNVGIVLDPVNLALEQYGVVPDLFPFQSWVYDETPVTGKDPYELRDKTGNVFNEVDENTPGAVKVDIGDGKEHFGLFCTPNKDCNSAKNPNQTFGGLFENDGAMLMANKFFGFQSMSKIHDQQLHGSSSNILIMGSIPFSFAATVPVAVFGTIYNSPKYLKALTDKLKKKE
jgi:hypothetical protein